MILKLRQMLNTFVPLSGLLYFWNLVIKRRKESYYDWVLPGWILRLTSWKLKDTLTINVLFDEINHINVDLIGRNCNEMRRQILWDHCIACRLLFFSSLLLHWTPLASQQSSRWVTLIRCQGLLPTPWKTKKHDLPFLVVGKHNEITKKPYSTLNRSVMISYIAMLTTYKNLN